MSDLREPQRPRGRLPDRERDRGNRGGRQSQRDPRGHLPAIRDGHGPAGVHRADQRRCERHAQQPGQRDRLRGGGSQRCRQAGSGDLQGQPDRHGDPDRTRSPGSRFTARRVLLGVARPGSHPRLRPARA